MSIDTIQDTSSLLYPTNTVLTTDTTVLLVSTGTISIVLIILVCIIVCGICIAVKYKKTKQQSVANRSSHSLKIPVETNPSYISISNNETELLYMEVAQLQDNPRTNINISSTIEPTENISYGVNNLPTLEDYDYII